MFTGCSSIPPAMKIPFLYSFPPPRSSPLSEFSLPPPLVPGIKPNEGPHRILRSQHTINYFFIHFYLDYEETDVTRAFQHAHPRYLALVKRISPLRGWTNWFRSSIARAKKLGSACCYSDYVAPLRYLLPPSLFSFLLSVSVSGGKAGGKMKMAHFSSVRNYRG